jgi:hypothetical protein
MYIEHLHLSFMLRDERERHEQDGGTLIGTTRSPKQRSAILPMAIVLRGGCGHAVRCEASGCARGRPAAGLLPDVAADANGIREACAGIDEGHRAHRAISGEC